MVVRGQFWSHLVVVRRGFKVRLVERAIIMGSMEVGLGDPGGVAPLAPLLGPQSFVVKDASIHGSSLSGGHEGITMTRRCQRVSPALVLAQGGALSHSVPFPVFLIHLWQLLE